MDLKRLQHDWDSFGRDDPFWAVLTHPDRRGNRWDADAFFATGRLEIKRLMQDVAALPITLARGRVLDFGCGVGRLSQALAEHFEQVVGVDIAPSMLKVAQQHNRHGKRCVYVLNEAPDLKQFEDGAFDMVYSNITLQHVRPKLAEGYVREFVRLLKPGGLAVFHLPSHNDWSLRGMGFRCLPLFVQNLIRRRTHGGAGIMELHAVRRRRVEALIAAAGGRLVDVRETHSTGRGWVAYRYAVRRAAAGA